MNHLNLPEPIAAYFEADRKDPDAVARCFTAQGVVKDENHTHTGVDAIRAWKAAASAAYKYTSEPRAMDLKDGVHIVTSHVAGDFPGSPIDLRYLFRLERGRIASLEITV